MGRDVNLEEDLSDSTQVYPLRPSLFPNVPPYVKFIPVSGKNCYSWDGAPCSQAMIGRLRGVQCGAAGGDEGDAVDGP